MENATVEQRRAKILDKLQEMRLLDDSLMTKFFEEELQCTEFVLRIILDKPDLMVKEAKTQYNIKNLQGRSARLDVRAVCGKGKIYDIEVERSDKRASPKRARHNLSILDSNALLPGDDVEKLPETYVIMITENDFWGKGEPIYQIKRYVGDTGIVYNDSSYIIYVNGDYKDDSPEKSDLAKLIHDFNCQKADDMYSSVLANRLRYFKEDEKGRKEMCKVIEDLMNEEKKEIAITMLEEGFPIEQIARLLRLTADKVEEFINGEKMLV